MNKDNFEKEKQEKQEKKAEAVDTQVETDVDTEQNDSSEDMQLDIEAITKALKEALAKQEEYLAMAQRVQADFDNYRKRNANIRKDAFDDGKIDFVKSLLPIVDNFQWAMDSIESHGGQDLLSGVQIIYKQIIDLLEKNNIVQIDRLGEVYDPNLEEVVTQGSPDDGEPGTVCEVLQKGYKMNDTVIRYSMVKVVPR